MGVWCRKLQEELLLINAPVLVSGLATGEPGSRSSGALTGETRASSRKRYLSYYRQWRLWLGEAELGRPADLVDYLLARAAKDKIVEVWGPC